jgi:hypothetical protein
MSEELAAPAGEPAVPDLTDLPYAWIRAQVGDPIPEKAVLSGETKSDGLVYIARNSDGGLGKVNINNPEEAKVYNFWAHGGKDTQFGDVLVLKDTAMMYWTKVKAGDDIPPEAVFGGKLGTDDTYACRGDDHEPGKLIAKDEKVVKLLYHSHWRARYEGEILCISFNPSADPSAKPPTDAGYSAQAPPVPKPPKVTSLSFGLTGSRIELSNGDSTATRASGVEGGICVSKELLPRKAAGFYYELRIEQKTRSIRAPAVGIIVRPRAHDINEMKDLVEWKEEARHFERVWMMGYDHGGALFISDGTETKINDDEWRPVICLDEGSVIGVAWMEQPSGPELVIFQDGVEKVRRPATGQLPRPDEDIRAIVDLQGSVNQATIICGKEPPPSKATE